MNASIINIGDELLIGQVANTNATFMAEKLNEINIDVARIVTIADDPEAIKNTLKNELKSADVVILTGGLGPTKDDMTKQVLHQFFGGKMVTHEPTLQHVTRYFSMRNLPLSDINRQQAEVPESCQVLFNEVGTAPGMWFENGGKIVISLPGVPSEMKFLMKNAVLPKLETLPNEVQILHKTILTAGIGESFLAEKIADWENNLPKNFKLAYLPQAGLVRLRLTAHGTQKNELRQLMDEQLAQLEMLIEPYIVGEDKDTPETIVNQLFTEKKLTVSTVESCSGGALAARIVSVAGSSAYFLGGIVAYSNEVKAKMVGVSEKTLEKFGAVSQQTAEEMARGCREKFGTDFAVATTGIAGPTGGSNEKPVGTVWIAVATKNDVSAKKYLLGNDRPKVIERTVNQAITDLLKIVNELTS